MELKKILAQLKHERSLIFDKEYPGSVGSLKIELEAVVEEVDIIQKKIAELNDIKKDLDSGIVAIERLIYESGVY